jgi:hypothetical protein
VSRTNLCGRLAGMLLAGLLLAVTEGVAHELAAISEVSEESPRCDSTDVRSPEALTCSVPKIDVPASHALARDGFEQVEIGVVFHVLMGPDQDGDISEARVRAQLDVLNGAFRPFNISFFLAELIRHPHSDYFEFRCAPSSANGQEMKEKLAIDPVRLVNIYTCALPFPVVIGFSTFPWDAPDSPESHGIVLHHEVVTGGSGAPFNLGHTLVHEMGHYFGLVHTFQGGCEPPGDLVSDTPAERTAALGCPTFSDSCPGEGADPVSNFMNYSDDACTDNFTAEQGNRMRDFLWRFRSKLVH